MSATTKPDLIGQEQYPPTRQKPAVGGTSPLAAVAAKDGNPSPTEAITGRLLRANSCRPPRASRTGSLDPLLPFKIGPVNGRKAQESGLRLQASVAPSIGIGASRHRPSHATGHTGPYRGGSIELGLGRRIDSGKTERLEIDVA